jgi:putative membrane protein
MRDFLTIVLMVIITTPATAQMGNPAGFAPDTRMQEPGVPAAHQTNNQDRLFAQLAAAGGLAEVDFGKLAGTKAADPSVKEFAQAMVQDHSDANTKLKALADAAKIPLPDTLDADQKATRQKLDAAEGQAFDVAYIRAQIIDHQKTAQLLTWEIGSGEDAQLQRYAAATLPAVMKHLRMAQNIASALTGQASPDVVNVKQNR